jgi:arylformamidase
MKATIHHSSGDFTIDFSKPIDISLATDAEELSSSAWYVDPIKIEVVRTDQFVGSVAEGGTTNFRNIFFNPHGNTTHTECVGHIANEVYSINEHLTTFFVKAKLVTIEPEIVKEDESEWSKKGDGRITLSQIQEVLSEYVDAIVIRTMPNTEVKKATNWSSSNWSYLTEAAAAYLAKLGVKHLLIDLPSVDREFDNGLLLAHHAFWNHPKATRFDATITEMIYVPNQIKDGDFFLNLQPASFVNDASPCKPVLYSVV